MCYDCGYGPPYGTIVPKTKTVRNPRLDPDGVAQQIKTLQDDVLNYSIWERLSDVFLLPVSVTTTYLFAETKETYLFCMNLALHVLISRVVFDPKYGDENAGRHAMLDRVRENIRDVEKNGFAQAEQLYDQFVAAETDRNMKVSLPKVAMYSPLRDERVRPFLKFEDGLLHTEVSWDSLAKRWQPDRNWMYGDIL